MPTLGLPCDPAPHPKQKYSQRQKRQAIKNAAKMTEEQCGQRMIIQQRRSDINGIRDQKIIKPSGLAADTSLATEPGAQGQWLCLLKNWEALIPDIQADWTHLA